MKEVNTYFSLLFDDTYLGFKALIDINYKIVLILKNDNDIDYKKILLFYFTNYYPLFYYFLVN